MQINALIHRFAASYYLEIIYTLTEAYVQGINQNDTIDILL